MLVVSVWMPLGVLFLIFAFTVNFLIVTKLRLWISKSERVRTLHRTPEMCITFQ